LNNQFIDPKYDWEINGGKPRPLEIPRVIESGNEPMVDVEASQDRLGSLQEKDKIYYRRAFHEFSQSGK
jgi:hypothetical protein